MTHRLLDSADNDGEINSFIDRAINRSGKIRTNTHGFALVKRTLLLICFLLTPTLAYSQITLTISKTNNAPNPIPSGQPFTYTITYSWSGGAPGTLYIVDNVPAQLDVISALPSNPISTILGNQVTFAISGLTLPSGSGTVQINARFKPGVTCGGTRACNRASITANLNSGNYIVSNEDCVTAAAPVNRWTIEKEWIAGCAVDDEVTFRIKIMNPSGNDIGGLNLTNVVLNDIIPPNAQVISITGNWLGIVGTTLQSGPSTLTVSPWNTWYIAYVKLKFPSTFFTSGQQVINTASMTFNTPCSPTMTTWTDTAKVTLCQGVTSGSLGKWLSLNMSLPSNPSWYPLFTQGCCGTYNLSYTNNGTLGQTGFVMEDIVPTQLDVNAIRTNVPSGNTPVTVEVFTWSGSSCSTTPSMTTTYTTAGFHTLTGLPANVCRVRWSYSGTIAVSQNLYNNLDVCVRSIDFATGLPVVTGQNVVNTVTATATSLPTITVTHTKAVDATAPKVVTTKLFIGGCNNACQVTPNGPFQPGDIVRFRIAVANIGSANANTCSITDLLPSGLSYIGNPTYYYGSFNWMANIYNPPCCSLTTTVPSQIGGTITSPSVGATSLTWTFPVLPARCDGLVDYLLIDFDVKISDNPPAPPGQYINTFAFSAGNVPSVPSNQAFLTVNATAQLQAIKEVRKQGSGGTWASSATVPANGLADFRITVKNTGNTSLTNLCLLDIMPYSGDIKVLPAYTSRGSLFDMPYNPADGAITITPGGFSATYNSIGLVASKNPMRTTICGGFCGATDPSGAVNGTFNTSPVQTYSLRTSANPSVNLLPGATLNVVIPARVPASGVQAPMTACNSFAVQAVPQGMPSVCLSAESNNACVQVAEKEPCIRIIEERLNCVGQNSNGAWVYQFAANITNLTSSPATIQIIPSTGSLASLNPTTILPGTPVDVHGMYVSGSTSGQVCFTIVLYAQGHEQKLCDTTICLDLKPCPDPCPCPFKIELPKHSAVQASGNLVWVNNTLTISGSPVQKVEVTIVGATITQTCKNGTSTTYVPGATINWSNWNPATAIGLGTSQVSWTNLLCPTITNMPHNMYINFPNAPGKGCTQLIKFCLKYTITDCKCNTCDTVICYELTRKWSPFDHPIDLGDIKIIRGKADKPDEEILNNSTFAEIEMSSLTEGTLSVNNPAEDDETIGITIHSVELISSPGIRPVSMNPDRPEWSQGTTSDEGLISTGSLMPGSTINFAVEFENNESFRSWDNTVRFTYTLQDVPDTLSGIVSIRVRTPGATGGDTIIKDYSSAELINNARTYALRFMNANVTGDSISTLILRVKEGNILATGPNMNMQEVRLDGYFTSQGNYIFGSNQPDQGIAILSPVPAGQEIGPLFITISHDPESSVTLEYETITPFGDIVTKGSIELGGETSTMIEDPGLVREYSVYLSDSRPNPAASKAEISFYLQNDEENVFLILSDTRGTEIMKPIDGKYMLPGWHSITINTEDLPSGTYYYTLRTGKESQTRKIIVIR